MLLPRNGALCFERLDPGQDSVSYSVKLSPEEDIPEIEESMWLLFGQYMDSLAAEFEKDAAYPTVAAAHDAGYATMNYGLFFQNIIDFIIIAFCIFCVIRAIAKAKERAEEKKKAEEAAAAAAKAAEPPAETVEDILKDIRAALKK